ncbi:MAG: tetratricopeptide repeat protein [Thiohalobacteraceae bacterium]
MNGLLRLFIPAALVLLSTACATYTVDERRPPVIERGSAPTEPEFPRTEPAPLPPPVSGTAIPAPPPENSAVIALMERADRQYQTRDLDAAAASLERALRIEPRNALLWHRLAAVRLDLGQQDQAIQLANKSNSLAGGDRGLQARNWQLIANARRAKGDLAGAQAADQKAAQFE